MDVPIGVARQSEIAGRSDPRSPHRRQHTLVDPFTIALCAVIAGADSWVEVAAWGRAKHGWLGTVLELPASPPTTR